MDRAPEWALDWSALLDELKQKESIKSDAKLASHLGVSRGYICSVRKGRKSISIALAETIFKRLGRVFDLTDHKHLFVPLKVHKHTERLSYIRKMVIERAKGQCQLCGENAPFQSPDGTPYLEMHNAVSGSDEESITPEKFVALCPNCHRKVHCCPSPEEIKKLEIITIPK